VALAVCVGAGVGTAQLTSGCQTSPTLVPVRSLQNSGKVSFVCLSPLEPSERPLAECTAQQFTSICEYEYQDDAGAADADIVRDDAGIPVATLFPHLYALVTQKETGEVAVVDTSALAGQVLDENPLEPGADFIHVGALPTGIASTPGSVATFVGVGEIGREGLFAIPSDQIRPATSFGVPDTCAGDSDAGAVLPPGLASWPACNLPSAPGDIILIDDPPDPQNPLLQRTSCDSTTWVAPAPGSISAREGDVGRAKLVVAFPTLGGIGVFDAQTLFQQPPGSFDACPIERWVPLKVDIAGIAGQPAPPTGLACSNPKQNVPPLLPLCPDGGAPDAGGDAGAGCFYAQPGGMSYADGKLYVADLGAPVIHVVDMHDSLGNATPCNPIEQAPLLPSSAEQPERVVYASKVAAASQLTPDFKRYLYATDYIDASAMIFDISPSSTTRRPLTRAHPEWDPFHPRDRVKFAAPPADIIIVQRDAPNIDPVTGLAPAGVLCNPDPNALSCTATSHNCDPGVAYQTSADYSTGAGPLKLRGEFAFAALTNGRLAVIDISDFDAPCRGPVVPSVLAGCSTNGPVPQIAGAELVGLKTTTEVSCNVVAPGEARAAQFVAAGSYPGNHVPGVLSFPLLYQDDGSVFAPGSPVPQMVSTVPTIVPPACGEGCNLSINCTSSCVINDPVPGCPLETYVGGNLQPLYTASDDPGTFADCTLQANGITSNLTASTSLNTDNALSMNIEDPRAQVAGQNWTVTFEGSLPSFGQRIAYWQIPTSGPVSLADPNSRFCDQGVLGENAVSEQLVAKGLDPTVHPSAADLADYVQITNNLPDATDTYWTGASTACNPVATYGTCFAEFGTTDQIELDTTRDLRILEAYEDHVDVETRNPFPAGPHCGSPTDAACVSPQSCVIPAGSTTGGHCQLPPLIDLLRCCFPTALTFTVRTGNQWNVIGDQSGFLHHVVADGVTGACRNNCDGNFQRMNGRLVGNPTGAVLDRPVGEIDPSPAFMNPMFRFAINSGACSVTADCTTTGSVCLGGSGKVGGAMTGTCNPARDTVFKFTTVNPFVPLLVSLTSDPTVLVEPTSATYLSATQEVAITDGSFSGLIMVSLQTAAFSRSFF
jgi:hypothetical protein